MVDRIISIDDQLEWLKIKNILDANDFPYRSIDKQDSAFPGIASNFEIDLIFAEELTEQFYGIVERKDFKTRLIEAKEKSSKPIKLSTLLLVAYGLLMTILFIKYYHISSQNSDKNFDYSWNLDNTALIISHKSFPNYKNVYTDKNYDYNYELMEIYVNGIRTTAIFDEDENGISEKSIFYDKKNQIAGYNLDENQDGFVDKTLTILESGDTLLLLDKNSNLIFEKVK